MSKSEKIPSKFTEQKQPWSGQHARSRTETITVVVVIATVIVITIIHILTHQTKYGVQATPRLYCSEMMPDLLRLIIAQESFKWPGKTSPKTTRLWLSLSKKMMLTDTAKAKIFLSARYVKRTVFTHFFFIKRFYHVCHFFFFICICFYSVIGFPSGSAVLKKFSRFATLQTLYDFVRVTLSLEQSKFSIVTDHPRVVYDSYPMNTLLLGSGKPKPVVFQACIHWIIWCSWSSFRLVTTAVWNA